MKKAAKIIFSLGFIFTIGLGVSNSPGEKVEEKQVHAEQQPQLIITPMSYDQWIQARIDAGYSPSMTRSEWNERGYN